MNRQLRRTTLIIAFSVAVVLGVASAYWVTAFPRGYIVPAILLALVTARSKRITALLALVLLGILVGNARGAVTKSVLDTVPELYDTQVVLRAEALTDGTYSSNGQLGFDVGDIHFVDPIDQSIPGKMKVEGFGINAIYRGDYVEIEGKLRDTLGSRQGRIGFADIAVIERGNEPITNIRHEFTAGMLTSLPEPQASFGLGLLIGEKNTLPKAVSDNLAAVGLTHIIAVSGYNLTIIVMAIRRLLSRGSAYQTTMVATLLVASFVVLTGFSASIVRAAIVSMLSIVAWYYGRTIRPLLLITMTAAVTAFWNPIYVWADAGWYLSFLAFFGVLILAPTVQKRFWKKPQNFLGMIVLESFCAQLMTMPYVLYTFSQISLLALPVNVLIVPLVPLAMLLSLIAGLAGMFIVSMSGWFAWPAKLLLTYILDIATLFARLPHAVAERGLSLSGLILLYVVLGAGVIVMTYRNRQRDTITDRNTEIV